MNCERYRTLMAEELIGAIPDTDRRDLAAHMETCTSCREEAALLRRTWVRMGALPEPEAPPFMATRFGAALDAYQSGLAERRTWRAWAPWAAAMGCLALGLFVGATAFDGRGQAPEVAEMRREIASMRQMVTLSLLQQQSATERLQGVTWSYQAAPNDAEVLSALLRTVNTDTSVDVRLAAVDALKTLGDSVVARRGLVQALEKQTSPLVQIAVVDALVEMRESSSAAAMRRVLQRPEVSQEVRNRIETALRSLQQ